MIDPHRLPRSVIPNNYRLRLEPDLEAASFEGRVDITAEVTSTTSVVVLNSIELAITDVAVVELESGTSSEVRVKSSFELDDELQRLTISCERDISPGRISIIVEFSGLLNDQLRGFYRSTYSDEDGDEHTIATTQFQSTDARRAFPCFDEPDFKATFDITLVVDSELLAVSNSAEVSAEPSGGDKVARTYATTMKMSTYLVAFVIGPLEQTTPIDINGVPLSVVHRPGQGHLTAFALEAAAASLNYFTDYYDIAYPGDKIDLIAIPDFAFGAMENLGCITFREVLLLVDPEHATQPELQNVADVVAHELAHMWFGDLVTMAWWEGIWLNEAFATFMEMKATDSFKPEWNRWTNFGLSRTAAFDIDSLQATRAIEFPVESPAEAEAMFDVLTYEKGAAVVRMLEQFLGEETFREGIRAYLASHSYSNTETSDLWGALESTSGEAVREIMKTWIYQGGYPVVSIDDQGKLWQRRFSYGEQTDDSIWAVPIRLRDKAGAQHRVLLTDHSANSPLPTAEVVVLNHEGAGFYRSQLSAEQLDRIGHEGPGDLSAVERFGLLDDTWALVIAGRIELDQYFNLLAGFGEETDISVWQRIAGSLTTIDHLLDGDRRPAFAAFVSQLLRPAFDRLGKVSNRSETDEQLRLRGVLLGALGTVGQDHELRQFSRELHSSGAVDPALLAAAVNVIAATGDTAEFNDFLERFSEPDSPQDMQRYLYALADFPSVEHGIHMAELTLSERVRSQNGPYVLQRLLQNREVGVDVWQFVTTNWDEIIEKFPGNSISRMLAGVTALSTPELEVQVRSFLAAHEVPQGATKIQQHLERLATNTRFRARLADSTIPGDH